MSQTYKPSNKRRKKRHGFLKRNKTKSGKNILKKRRREGRKSLTRA